MKITGKAAGGKFVPDNPAAWPSEAPARIRSRIDSSKGPDACWLWTGGAFPSGYGFVSIFHRSVRAHRAAWVLFRGAIPNGLLVLHRCDVRLCCNPGHLFLGTAADNMADRDTKGRQAKGDRNGTRTHPERVTRGERHPAARLTVEKVREIREALSRGERKARIARRFGVCWSAVHAIAIGQTWSHVA